MLQTTVEQLVIWLEFGSAWKVAGLSQQSEWMGVLTVGRHEVNTDFTLVIFLHPFKKLPTLMNCPAINQQDCSGFGKTKSGFCCPDVLYFQGQQAIFILMHFLRD